VTIVVLLAVPVAAADGPLDDWPHCAIAYTTDEPPGYALHPECLEPLPDLRP
jgi:hypothetical protein